MKKLLCLALALTLCLSAALADEIILEEPAAAEAELQPEQEIAPEPVPADEPRPKGKIALHVTARGLADGAWQNGTPSFLLEGIPEGAEGCGYAAIICDERIVPLSGNEYSAREEGAYDVRFAILDALGDIAAKSEKYQLMLDFTAPELTIDISAERDYTMTLRARDALSGVTELSLDGGDSWVSLNEGESIVYTEARRKAFAPGTIQVRDLAGNVGLNLEEIVLDVLPNALDPEERDDVHAPALPEGPVKALMLDGEVLGLSLELESGNTALFTEELIAEDALVVRAEVGESAAPFDCIWRINGSVLRRLYNADIKRLALAAGDAVLSLPTGGFAAGTRYAELKMAGVSTAEFEYEIAVHVDPNAAEPVSAEIHAEVAGEQFDMIDRVATPEMYPLDVYCGPADQLEHSSDD